jgi:hypothetical protein
MYYILRKYFNCNLYTLINEIRQKNAFDLPWRTFTEFNPKEAIILKMAQKFPRRPREKS